MKLPRALLFLLATGVCYSAHAASPPALVNYQGVLRDNNDKPLTGTFDMTFGFYDAQNAGNQILVDAHTGASAVGVSGGQFNVQLGSGTVSDGSGPGTYTALDQVFRDYAGVWMEIVIGGQTLSPRIRVVGAPYALNASNLEGKNAANFIDTSATGQTKAGMLNVNGGMNIAGTGFGLSSNGTQAGGAFGAGNSFAYVADLGSLKSGIRAQGDDAGGWFLDNLTGSKAYTAYGDYGVQAQGARIGGYFLNSDASTFAECGAVNTGIRAQGTLAGAAFYNSQGSANALCAKDNDGVQGFGLGSGGYFSSLNRSGTCNAGYGDYGVYAGGHYPNGAGGYFYDLSNSGKAWLSYGSWGVKGSGNFCGAGCGGGGFFTDVVGGAVAYVGYSDVGIETHASGSGGSFYNNNGISTAVATSGGFGVVSNGTKSFLQNHPEDPNALVAYTALEGDEAGTYTRGTASLVNGEARVSLGDTFKWVTDPDIGLTAHLTPVGRWADLYVASKSTRELVVRSRDPHAPDTAFDYVVFGLREGFESAPVVREKEHEMPIPAGASGDSLFAKKPELKRFTALARFQKMQKVLTGKDGPLDMSASEALKSNIHVFDPVRDGDAFRAPAPTTPPAGPSAESLPPLPGAQTTGSPAATAPPGAAPASGGSLFPPNSSVAAIGAPVEAGEVVTNDAERPGLLKSADQPADAGVIGIVAGDARIIWTDRAPLALAGTIVLCKVDASYGPVLPNDLLVASPTPGHAMRAGDNPRQGTVVAKALEPLEAGTGTIRVLAMSR